MQPTHQAYAHDDLQAIHFVELQQTREKKPYSPNTSFHHFYNDIDKNLVTRVW